MTTIPMRGACRVLWPVTMALALAACAGPQGARSVRAPAGEPAAAGAPASPPAARGGGYYLDDGPGANPPPDLASIPDAVPRAEPLLPRTLRPYAVFGRQYTPMTRLEPFRERGMASWYGKRYHGQPTSSGERYDMYAMTAAHPTLPIPSYVRVTHTGNGRSVVVRVNDRGPFLQGRVIDLSYTAAAKLGYVASGSAEVDVELITRFDEAAATVASAAAPAAASTIATAPATALATATASTIATATAPATAPATGSSIATTPAAAPPVVTMASVDPGSTSPAAAGQPHRGATGPGAAGSGAVASGAAASGTTDSGSPAPQIAAGAAPAASERPRLNLETVHAPNEPSSVQRARAADRESVAAAPGPITAPAPATAPMAVVASPASARSSPPAPSAASTSGFWLQLGAFGSLDNARSAMSQLARRLDWLGAAFDIRQEGALYKVQAGPWKRREQAAAAAERIRAATELRPFATLR